MPTSHPTLFKSPKQPPSTNPIPWMPPAGHVATLPVSEPNIVRGINAGHLLRPGLCVPLLPSRTVPVPVPVQCSTPTCFAGAWDGKVCRCGLSKESKSSRLACMLRCPAGQDARSNPSVSRWGVQYGVVGKAFLVSGLAMPRP